MCPLGYTTANSTLPTRYTYTGQYSYIIPAGAISDPATDLGANASFGLTCALIGVCTTAHASMTLG